MEIRYIVTGSLVMFQGDISDVEAELFITLVMLLHTVVGRDFYETTVGETIGIISSES